jgi:hypothetical protein
MTFMRTTCSFMRATLLCALFPILADCQVVQAQVQPESVQLRCDGIVRRSKAGEGGWPEQRERISIRVTVNPSTGDGEISGHLPIAQAFQRTPMRFDITDRVFAWTQSLRDGTKSIASKVEIDRYAATLEATDVVMDGDKSKGSIWTLEVAAKCTRYQERAF